MKKIGIIGGMSWESTLEYYRLINEGIKENLGGHHSAEIIMYSVDFQKIHDLQFKGDWKTLARILTDIALKLQEAGADFLLIATNTMHKLAPEIEREVSIPILHIADATGKEIINANLKKVGLLGTKFTMEMEFYRDRLKEKYGIEVLIPEEEEREYINDVIYRELVLGIIKEESKKKFKDIIEKLSKRGAQGIILGCTEIPLLIKQEDVKVPVFSTTEIHARAAVNYAIGKYFP